METVVSRLPVALSLLCLLAIGASLPVVAQSPSPSVPVGGPQRSGLGLVCGTSAEAAAVGSAGQPAEG